MPVSVGGWSGGWDEACSDAESCLTDLHGFTSAALNTVSHTQTDRQLLSCLIVNNVN